VKVALIGVGQAGGKIVEALLAHQDRTGGSFVTDAVAVNTARADLRGLDRIPADRRVLIGGSRVKGHGAGADNDLGAELMAEDVDEVLSVIDEFPLHAVDAFLVVAGLGGGTGSGGAPVLARELGRLYAEPVYGLGVLPGRDEGGIYALNAARSFRTFVDEVDGLLAFDNDAWRRSGESLGDGYASMNEELARRLGVLFGAGEVDGRVAETVVDASEVINTLGAGGVTSIGYAVAPVEREKRGLLARLSGGDAAATAIDEGESTNRVVSLVRRAALGRLTLPCELRGTERALVIVTGPADAISRRGVERARSWVEEETGTMEVRGGDYPVDSDFVGAVVVLSGVTDVPRIRELQATAVESNRAADERAADHDTALADLLATDDELEPLF